MSLARNDSLSPRPRMIGLPPLFAATRWSGRAIADRAQGVGALELAARRLHRREQVVARTELDVDQVGDQLGVGVRLHRATRGLELLPELAVVLDDAVVHDRHAARAMGMGVALRGLAVGGPARVSDAETSADRVVAQRAFEIRELPQGAADFDRAVVEDGDARRVVAPVLQSTKAVDQDVHGALVASDVADDSTHGAVSPPPAVAWAGVRRLRFPIRRPGCGAAVRPSPRRCAASPGPRPAPRRAPGS